MIEHTFASRQARHPRPEDYRALMSRPQTPPDGVALAALVAAGEVTPRELVEAAIARAAAVNEDLNAIIHPLYESALAAAGAEGPRGPLWGVPFLTKDLMCATEGDPYHAGNIALRDAGNRALHDTHLATMFRELGLLNLGRTNTPEFGLTPTTEPVAYGPSRNPWHLDHSTGGSSGGSAAAVAAGVVPIAHANDGGGSIRIPASECGLFGLKPTRGRVSAGPDAGVVWAGAAIEGVVSRSVRDSAVVLDGISRVWPGDPYWAPPPQRPFADAPTDPVSSLRVGICSTSSWGPVHGDCATAVEATGRLLESLGHRVETSHPEPLFDPDFFEVFPRVLAVSTAEMVDALGRQLGRPLTREDMEGDTAALVALGRSMSGVDYVRGIEWFHDYTRRMAWWWEDFDVLVTPTLAEPPPRLGELRDPATGGRRLRDLLHFTAQFNVTGQPAMSVPLHWSADGLPVGVQVVGRPASEYELLQLAGQMEAAAPWADRLPPVFAA